MNIWGQMQLQEQLVQHKLNVLDAEIWERECTKKLLLERRDELRTKHRDLQAQLEWRKRQWEEVRALQKETDQLDNQVNDMKSQLYGNQSRAGHPTTGQTSPGECCSKAWHQTTSEPLL
jgi:SMC interacting uncharacterized protein involved in chromosome segregation